VAGLPGIHGLQQLGENDVVIPLILIGFAVVDLVIAATYAKEGDMLEASFGLFAGAFCGYVAYLTWPIQ
jgi:hypothetical protein